MNKSNSIQIDQQYVIEKIRQVLIEFIKNFQKNPFEYFYEEDLRASLQNFLNSEINIRNDFPTKIFSNALGTAFINSSIVKSEYPSYRRFDIAILGYDDGADFYNQPVNFAIELKLGSNKIYSDKTGDFKSDIIKLRDHLNNKIENFTGLAIYFCQSDIDESDIVDWYRDLPDKFKLIEANQLYFERNKVNAIIVPVNSTNQIFLL